MSVISDRVASLTADRSRVSAAVLLLVVTVAVAVVTGGVPLTLGLGVVAGAIAISLPPAARRYLARRVIGIAGSLLIAMWLVWLLAHNLPDRSRQDATGVVASTKRFVAWLGDLVGGDLGRAQYSESVWEGISRTLPLSLQLPLYSQVLAFAIAVPGALVAARYRGRLSDIGIRAIGLLGLAAPIIIVGPILVFTLAVGELGLFGIEVGWKILPAGRYVPVGDGVWEHARSMFLPSVTLAVTTLATYLVLLRTEIIHQLQQDHALLALAKGIGPRHLVRRHGLRPAMPAVVALSAAQTGAIIGNMILVERIFTLPGFGDYVVVAIGRRDIVAVAGAIFVAALVVAVINVVAEAVLLVVDPRIADRENQ